MVKASLEGITAGAAGLVLALGSALLLSCSPSSSSSPPQSSQHRRNITSPSSSPQPSQTQTPIRSSNYEHPNFAYVAANPDSFSGHNIELTGYWVQTSSGGLRLGYGIRSRRVLTDMLTNESPLASRYNDIICSPPLQSIDPEKGIFTTTLKGEMRNRRLRVHSGYITGPDGTVYNF